MLQRYTADDRLVKDKEAEIEELKKKLETVKETAVGSESISLNERTPKDSKRVAASTGPASSAERKES